MSPVDTAALVSAARGGDVDAFASLVEACQAPVRALAYARTGDADDTDEVVQQTFIVAWHKLASMAEPARFTGWVCGIARRIAVRTVARRRRTQPDDAVADRGSTAAFFDRLEAHDLVWRTLAELPPRYREPLVMFHCAGDSAQVVAEQLGLSVAAAEQRISRGRRMLAQEVERTLAQALAQRCDVRRSARAIALVAVASPRHSAAGSMGLVGTLAKVVIMGKNLAIVGGALVVAVGVWWGVRRPDATEGLARDERVGADESARPDPTAGRIGSSARDLEAAVVDGNDPTTASDAPATPTETPQL